MSSFDPQAYHFLGESIRATRDRYAHLLTPESRQHIEHYLSHNEYEMALESLSLSLLENRDSLGAGTVDDIRQLLIRAGLNEVQNRVLSNTLFEDITEMTRQVRMSTLSARVRMLEPLGEDAYWCIVVSCYTGTIRVGSILSIAGKDNSRILVHKIQIGPKMYNELPYHYNGGLLVEIIKGPVPTEYDMLVDSMT